MKRTLLVLTLLILSTSQSFSQHFKGSWLPVEYIGTHEGLRYFWFSPDNKYVYAYGQTEVIGFNVATGQKVFKVKSNGGTVHWPSASADGSQLLLGNYYENKNKDPEHGYMIPNLDVFDVKSQSWKKQSVGKPFINNATYSSESNKAYGVQSLNMKASVVQFQIEPYKELKNLTPNEKNEVMAYCVHESTGILAYSTIGEGKSLKFIDLATGNQLNEILKGKEISQLAITSDGKTLLAGAMYELWVIDLQTYDSYPINVNADESGMYVSYIDIHPNDRSVAISSRFGVMVIDLQTSEMERISKSSSMGCNFSPDGQFLAFAVKSLGDKTPCMYLYQDKQFEGSSFGNESVDLEGPEIPEPIEELVTYEHHCAKPAFSIETRDEPKETSKKTDKGRLLVTVTSGNKIFATTLTALELSPNYKTSKYDKLSQTIAENFVAKKDYKVVEKGTFDWHGQKAVRYLLKLKNFYYDYRVVTVNGYNYQFIFIYEEKMEDLTPVNDYFNSFKLK